VLYLNYDGKINFSQYRARWLSLTDWHLQISSWATIQEVCLPLFQVLMAQACSPLYLVLRAHICLPQYSIQKAHGNLAQINLKENM
jgi:hypothetical protein